MLKKLLTSGLLSATLLALAAPLTAQTTFQRAYGGPRSDCGYSVAQTADGGYIITGSTRSFGAGSYDVWLIKTDASGDTLWTRTFGGADGDWGHSVAQTTDSGYVIAGYTTSFGAGEHDFYLVKTDANGDTIWTRTFGGTQLDYGYSVAQTADGGYVVTGYTMSFGAGEQDVYLVKTDANGDTIWTRTFGGASRDCGYSVRQTADGGYAITGYTWSLGAGECDVQLIKTNALGEAIWTRTFGGAYTDIGYSLAQTADGGYVIAGYTASFGTSGYDVYLVKTDTSGVTMWTRTFGGADWDQSSSVAQTADEGYVIAGRTKSFGAGSYDVWLIKTDASGDTVWTRTFGGTRNDYGKSVLQTADGGYAITGGTESFGAGGEEVWLIKTDSAGTIAIAEPQPPVAFEPAAASIARAVLFLPEASGVKRGASCVMLGASGRKVMDLTPGANDIRHLAPGVYFVRGKGSRSQGSEGPSRKVILTR